MNEAIPVYAEALADFGELFSNQVEQTAVLVEQRLTVLAAGLDDHRSAALVDDDSAG